LRVCATVFVRTIPPSRDCIGALRDRIRQTGSFVRLRDGDQIVATLFVSAIVAR
jgi:hypothetical protein